MDAIKEIYDHNSLSTFLPSLSSLPFDQMAPSIHAAQILAPRHTTSDSDITSRLAQHTLAKMLPYAQERNNDWIGLATGVYCILEEALHGRIDCGDNINSVMLAIFIHKARQAIHTEPSKWEMLMSISKFDITRTQTASQNEIRALWNEIIRQVWAQDSHNDHAHYFLNGFRHLYAALRPPNQFNPIASPIVPDPSYYSLCKIVAHHQESTHFGPSQSDPLHHASPHGSHSGSTHVRPGSSAAPQAEEANITPVLPSAAGYLTLNS